MSTVASPSQRDLVRWPPRLWIALLVFSGVILLGGLENVSSCWAGGSPTCSAGGGCW
ncbi:hypothetical protein [Nonomuraea sp. SYSU D8015]|uniref:hypothetical protein n=1 Tax=Nonomuraea sp. SYSU D8015 TaxID=2593644 RepID=UPI001CB6F1C6|nr:hypothetical protein [Nonomuraea sp. SYSU D8015]